MNVTNKDDTNDCEGAEAIFLDEFDRAPPKKQNAALSLVYGDGSYEHSISSYLRKVYNWILRNIGLR